MTAEQKVKLNQLIQTVETRYLDFRQAPDNSAKEFNAINRLMAARARLRDYVDYLVSEASK